MTKMTIVTDPQGNLVGAVHGHTLASKYGNLEAKVSFPENDKLHKVEVEDDIERSPTQPYSNKGCSSTCPNPDASSEVERHT